MTVEKANRAQFAKTNLLVVGDVMLDRYWFGDSDRISPEAPVPVVQVSKVDERLGGAANVARNVAALGANTTASNNTAVGSGALGANTTGDRNTAVGASALDATTTGLRNTANGYNALTENTTGNSNTALGAFTLSAATTADGNTAVGDGALNATTTGADNTAVGQNCMLNNTTGGFNTAIGKLALSSNTTAGNQTAVGYRALYTTTTGDGNAAFGFESLYNTTAYGNTALGSYAMRACTTGKHNTGIGYEGLKNLTTGAGNIGIQPYSSAETFNAVFDITTENNRISMGSTGVTNAYVQVAWTVVSDARDKININSVPHGLSFVNQLNPVSFQFKMSREDETPNGGKRYGFLAQDILALEGDDPVIIDNEVPEKLKYQGESLVPVLVKAIQELSTELDTVKAQNAAFETRLAALEAN
jgi:hypothetical protein